MENSGRLVFKPWERRLDKTECVESDADEELLINIPFTGDVKLKGLIVIGGEDDTHPDKVEDLNDPPTLTSKPPSGQIVQEQGEHEL